MVAEDLMRKYKYGYVHSCKLLEEPFVKDLLKENQEMKKDMQFCLHSIMQEMEMSKDERTRSEMNSCYEILKRWNKC